MYRAVPQVLQTTEFSKFKEQLYGLSVPFSCFFHFLGPSLFLQAGIVGCLPCTSAVLGNAFLQGLNKQVSSFHAESAPTLHFKNSLFIAANSNFQTFSLIKNSSKNTASVQKDVHQILSILLWSLWYSA